MSAHNSPAPWSFRQDWRYDPYIRAANSSIVATMNTSGKSYEEVVTNGLLLAAAPHMRALLQEILAMHDAQIQAIKAEGDYAVPHPITERIRAVLAKATTP